MRLNGQNTIRDAHVLGTTGIVFMEDTSNVNGRNWWSVLQPFELVGMSGVVAQQTLTPHDRTHPLWWMVPVPFVTPLAICGQLVNGGVEIAHSAECDGPGVAAKDGPARTVHITSRVLPGPPITWEDEVNANLLHNSLRWAAHCEQ
jgi:hypothetical protein